MRESDPLPRSADVTAAAAAGDFDGGSGGAAFPTVDLLQHSASCWRPRPSRSRLGRRAGGELVEELWCRACGATLRLVDGEPEAAGPAEPPTAYAAEKIREIEELWRGRDVRRPSKSAVAQLVGIDRGTLEEWIRREWLPWPPA